MGAGIGVVCSSAALRSAGQTPQGRKAHTHRLAPNGTSYGAAGKRLGLGPGALAPCLRRSSPYHRPDRPISLPILWQSVVPRLPSDGVPALRASNHAAQLVNAKGCIPNPQHDDSNNTIHQVGIDPECCVTKPRQRLLAVAWKKNQSYDDAGTQWWRHGRQMR